MPTHNSKKAERRQKKKQRRKQNQRQVNVQPIPPRFPTEQIGAPAAGASWLGQKVAALFKSRRRK